MPVRARKVCRSTGCGQSTARPDGYCQQCSDDGRNDAADYRRRKETDPFYLSPEWRKYRAWWLMHYPLCVVCRQLGQMVDHKVPIKEGGARLEPGNTQTLCHRCHAKKTGAERSGKRMLAK